MSMEVKDKRLSQGETTRVALLSAARELFGAQGYAATSLDEIVAKAGVTKGALYHHFSDKEALFRTVVEQLEQEVSDRAVAKFLQPDSWAALVDGCELWVEAHLDPVVRQIVLADARGALGWEAAHAIENRFSAVALRGALRKAMHAGVLERQPLRPLAVMLTGALSEACLYLAEADDLPTAQEEVRTLIAALLAGLRPPSDASPPRPGRSATSESTARRSPGTSAASSPEPPGRAPSRRGRSASR
jgi:AcrR family transcriptional regulator